MTSSRAPDPSHAFEPSLNHDLVIPFPKACAPVDIRWADRGQSELSDSDLALLDGARWWLVKSRLMARAVTDEACFLLAEGIKCEASAFGTAFFRVLDLNARRELRFFAVGARAVSNDERWFLQLLHAAMEDDRLNVEGLVGWRVLPSARRRAIFLASQLGEILQRSALESP